RSCSPRVAHTAMCRLHECAPDRGGRRSAGRRRHAGALRSRRTGPGDGGVLVLRRMGDPDRGRARDDEWLASESDAVGAREVVRDCYEAFLPLNTELLAACSAWQMRTVGGAAVPNVHRDPDYDARVLDRLSRIDESAQS